MRNIIALVLVISASIPSLALAEDTATSSDDATMRVENFDDDLVTGDLVAPQLDPVTVHLHGPRHTLVRPRVDFRPEMYRSVETL